MVVLGVDAHKRSHTVVAVDETGRKLGERTIATTTADHLDLLTWAEQFGGDRLWAIEDCRHLSRRLERDLLGAGQRIVRVPPKLMAHARDSARSYGKSDPIDALAVARAALREPDLPTARSTAPLARFGCWSDHREDLVAERTRIINRLRWHLHELDPSWSLRRAVCGGPNTWPRPQLVCRASTGWSRAWPAHCSSVAACSATRSPSSTESSNPWSPGSLRRCSNCAAARR